ncbi:hypothetical protein [Flammeovirga agarivorans]|uniref:Lipoprotein n=1 Tax=Flammeovirga agarivorans TaxID=2726742 RepID=A0A7X8SKU6_9BACT|nr:hypothetical protein [Flammeovirga agarivorans]NLR92069.1 hypothetical protein [Flammeovirga agarivorans]
MKNNLLIGLSVVSLAMGAVSCNPQENLSTSTTSEQNNTVPSTSGIQAEFTFENSNKRTVGDTRTDDVTIDNSHINVYASQNGKIPSGYYYDANTQTLMNVPYGMDQFYADYDAVIPADHTPELGMGIDSHILSENTAQAALDYVRDSREPIVNFLSATQTQDVNSTTQLDPFVMMPQNGRISFGIHLDAPSEFWRLDAEFVVYNKNGEQIGKVEGIPEDEVGGEDRYNLGFDYTDLQAVSGAYTYLKIKVIELNSNGERVNGPNDKQWILDGSIDGAYSIANGIAKGYAINIDEKFTPTITDLNAEFQFVQLVIDDEEVNLD